MVENKIKCEKIGVKFNFEHYICSIVASSKAPLPDCFLLFNGFLYISQDLAKFLISIVLL